MSPEKSPAPAPKPRPSRLRLHVFLGIGFFAAFVMWWMHLMQVQRHLASGIESRVHDLIRVQAIATQARATQRQPGPNAWLAVHANLQNLSRDMGSVRKANLLRPALQAATRLAVPGAAPDEAHLVQEAIDELVMALRRENAQSAQDLGTLWNSLDGLALVSILFAGAALVLLVVVDRRQQAMHALNLQLQQAMGDSGLARDQAEHANATKARFLANLSHELRTPLGGVIGLVDLALTGPLDAVQRHQLETAGRSARSLLLLINDILDFSRLEVGQLRVPIGTFDVREVVDDAAGGVAAAGQSKGLLVRVQVAVDVPAVWRGNGERVRQVLTNLLTNAIKFTERGMVQAMAAVQDDQLVLTVSDTGPGMLADELARIFEAFTQVDASATRRHRGAGLGLSICRELVERMGGSISVTSSAGTGTLFVVRMPAVGVGENSGEVNRALPPVPAVRWHHVWLDFGPGPCRDHLAELLASWGVQVRVREQGPSESPQELAIRELRPDLPRIAGRWAAAVPLAQTDAAQVARQLGARWLLFQPIRHDDLRTLVSGVAIEMARAVDQPADTSAPAGPLVLVVEDDAVAAAVAQAMLRKLGCQSELANDGEKAVRACAQRAYAAVLMDWQLPILDGIAATQAIRAAAAPGAPRMPIIALTASGEPSDRGQLQRVGIDDYLAKPATLDALAAALQRNGLPVTRRNRPLSGILHLQESSPSRDSGLVPATAAAAEAPIAGS